MTIGTSRGSGSVRAPKFLDKSDGFYSRLDEPEIRLLEKDEALLHGRKSRRKLKTTSDDADDQLLIRDKKMKMEEDDVMKVMKRNTLKMYRKAFRRGWEAFMANIYNVTLTSTASSKNKHQHNLVLEEFR
ncbi:uncharacterized protein LOC144065377 [Stigmatopora argus]